MPGPVSQSYPGPDDGGRKPPPRRAVPDMTDDEYADLLRRFRSERLAPGPGEFLCGMCGGVFELDRDDDEVRAEAVANGIDPDEAGVVCDDCYKLTPWGKAKG